MARGAGPFYDPGMGIPAIIGAWWVQQLAALPPPWVLQASLAAGVVLLLPSFRPGRRRGRTLAALAFGLLVAGWAGLRAQAALDERLPSHLEGQDFVAVGIVSELPALGDRALRFRFEVERCEPDGPTCPRGRSVRLGWYSGFGDRAGAALPVVVPGERWRLAVRLRRPHALSNPMLFDGEARRLADGIDAVGTVRERSGVANARLDAQVPGLRLWFERQRHRIRGAMTEVLAQTPDDSRAVLVALVIGDQAAIAARWWERFNRTGVGHLMSISGLHITMLAGLAGTAAGRIWRSRRLARRLRRPLPGIVAAARVRWCVAVATAFGYSLLAGWGIPAQRTCWMLAVAGIASLGARGGSPLATLGVAGGVVVMCDPWAPVAAGFWLSFAAVAAIVWAGAAHRAHGQRELAVVQAVSTQLVVTVALLPLGALFFSSFSWIGPVANAFAIPLVSILITPLALAGALFTVAWAAAGAPLLQLAGWLTSWLLQAIRWLDDGPMAVSTITFPATWPLLLAIAGCALAFAPLRFPGRRLAAGALLPLLASGAEGPPAGDLWLTAIDVGQGSALLVEARGQRILFDAGPQLGPDDDAGARTVVPYLRARGIRRLDTLVVSHLDADHSGGALAVLRNLQVDRVVSSLPDEHPIVAAAARHVPCRRGDAWNAAGVRFEWLHPQGAGADSPASGRVPTNARSCVLHVQAPGGALLLTGDIEAAQERELVAQFPDRLRADVLVVPHHGSGTSSTPAFIEAVAPKLAIMQLGYRNRYRHPSPKVLARYEAAGVQVLRSDRDGAVQLKLPVRGAPLVWRHRLDAPRYWTVRDEATGTDARATR